MVLQKTFIQPGSQRFIQNVELSDHVEVDGCKAHVVKIGRKYIEVLFYTGQAIKGRRKLDPMTANFLGTQHV